MTYVDVEALLVDDLASFGTTGTRTPADLQALIAAGGKFIRVTRRGGFDSHISDHPRVDVDVFASTRAGGVAAANAIREHLLRGFSIAAVDRVVTESSPQELPWEDPGVRRWVATYQVVTRRA